MDFETIIRERQATRAFSNKELEEEKITKILEAGRLAPTALNLQPFKIYVVKSEEGIKKMDLATSCRYGAPVVLLVCADKDKAYKKGDYSTYEMDASIVTTHMMLEATNLGVDNIWVELFDGNVLRREFNLPDNMEPICLLPIGYKSPTCPTSRNHGVRKDLAELVEYI
jgi:nitroreductase